MLLLTVAWAGRSRQNWDKSFTRLSDPVLDLVLKGPLLGRGRGCIWARARPEGRKFLLEHLPDIVSESLRDYERQLQPPCRVPPEPCLAGAHEAPETEGTVGNVSRECPERRLEEFRRAWGSAPTSAMLSSMLGF